MWTAIFQKWLQLGKQSTYSLWGSFLDFSGQHNSHFQTCLPLFGRVLSSPQMRCTLGWTIGEARRFGVGWPSSVVLGIVTSSQEGTDCASLMASHRGESWLHARFSKICSSICRYVKQNLSDWVDFWWVAFTSESYVVQVLHHISREAIFRFDHHFNHL